MNQSVTDFPLLNTTVRIGENSLYDLVMKPTFYWILFNAVLTLYLLISLSVYEYRIRKIKPIVLCRQCRFSKPGLRILPRIFCWISAMWLFVYWFHRLILSPLFLMVEAVDFCSFNYKLRTLSISVVRLFIMLALWTRQRFIYTNKAMKKTYKLGRFLSIVVGGFGLGVILGPLSIFLFAVELEKTNNVCEYVLGGKLQLLVFQYLRFFLIALYVSLTALFLVPLLNHSKKLVQIRPNVEKAERPSGQMNHLIVRTFVVCIFHVMMTFPPFFLPLFEDRELGRLIFAHTSATIPLMLNICIFVDWKGRFFPWRRDYLQESKNDEKQRQSNSNQFTLYSSATS